MVNTLFSLCVRAFVTQPHSRSLRMPEEVAERFLKEMLLLNLLDDESLPLLTHFDPLPSLDFSEAAFIRQEVLLQSASLWKGLKKLQMDSCRGNDEFLLKLSQSPCRETLEVLDMSRNLALSNKAFKEIEPFPALREATFNECWHLRDDIAFLFHEKFPSLAALNLKSVIALTDKFLENLCQDLAGDIQCLPHLTCLDVGNSKVTQDGVRNFLKKRRNLERFTRLRFSPSWFTRDQGWTDLTGEILQSCPSLQQGPDFRFFSDQLQSHMEHINPHLRKLSNEDDLPLETSCNVLLKTRELEVLSLQVKPEGDGDYSSLPIPASIRKFVLRTEDDGIIYKLPSSLFQLGCNLTSLKIDSFNVTPEVWDQVRKLIHLEMLKFRALEFLITAEAFSQGIQDLTHLHCLKLNSILWKEEDQLLRWVHPELKVIDIFPKKALRLSVRCPKLCKLAIGDHVALLPYTEESNSDELVPRPPLTDREYAVEVLGQGSATIRYLSVYTLLDRIPLDHLNPIYLTDLIFNVIGIEDEVFQKIPAAINLVDLDISDGNLTDETLESIFLACSRLNRLSLRVATITSLEKCRSHSLRYLSITSEGAVSTFTVPGLTTLEQVSLYGLNSLEYVDLSDRPLLDEIEIQYCRKLQVVKAKNNPMMERFILKGADVLKTLVIDSTGVEQVLLQQLPHDGLDIEYNCPIAEYLEINQCDEWPCERVEGLVSKSPLLETLDLEFNDKLTDSEWARQLGSRYPSLQLIKLTGETIQPHLPPSKDDDEDAEKEKEKEEKEEKKN